MNDRGEESILGRLAYAVGYTMGRADALIDDDAAGDPAATQRPPYPAGRRNDHTADPGTARTASPGLASERPAPRSPGHWSTPESDLIMEGHRPAAAVALGSLAAGWALSRLLRPRPVHWPRAILAGVAGTALAELVQNITQPDPERPRPFPPGPEDLPRYAAGIATAAAYAAQIYPRLPGSSLTRGLLFGTVEAMVVESGGAFGVLQRIAPDVRLPLASLATLDPPVRGPIASLAFGLGLGLYSARGRRR